MAGLGTHHGSIDRQPVAATRAVGVALFRAAGVSLAVLALLILLAAPAARGAAAGPGDYLWINWLDGPDHASDAIADVAEAPNGSLYAAGVVNDDWGSGADFLLMKDKVASPGSWTLEWDGPAGGADYFADLVVDYDSNAVIVGTSATTVQQENWAVVKYSPDRTLMWSALWDGSGLSDYAEAAVCDTAGNVYVCGSSEVSPTVTDWQVVKFRAGSGSVAWTYTYSAPAATHNGDVPEAIAIDESGDLYVTGTSMNKAGNQDILVIKLSRGGKRQWARRIDGAAHLYDTGVALATPATGGVCVAGVTWTGTAVNSLLITRLSASGRYLWNGKWRTWHDAKISGITGVCGIKLDAQSNVYLAGYTWQAAGKRGFVQKRDASGHLRWVRYYRPAGVEYSAFYDFTVSSAGRVWVAGVVKPSGDTEDWLLARYETDGTRNWLSTFDTPGSSLADWATAVTLCGTKALFVGGVMGTATNDDAGTAKYLR
jgi:hypothetical protein